MNLTGVWTADDSGIYYVQQFGEFLCWLGQSDDGSFQRGLQFTNIFVGTVGGTGPAPTVDGQWGDVPRCAPMNFGDLSLSVTLNEEGNLSMANCQFCLRAKFFDLLIPLPECAISLFYSFI